MCFGIKDNIKNDEEKRINELAVERIGRGKAFSRV